MKEQDIRDRIQTFLKETVRYVVVPASMGIGLALIGGAGCGSSDSSDDKDAGTVTMTSVSTVTSTSAVTSTGTGSATSTETGSVATKTDTSVSTSVVKYMAVMPDAGQAQPEYAAPIPRDAAVYSAPMMDAGTNTGTGTGTGTASTSTATATGTSINPVPLYMAVMPDAGAIEKYSAPVPRDAGQVVTDYMAPQPVYSAPLTISKTGTGTSTGTNPIARYHAIQPSDDSPTPSTSAGTTYAAPKLTGK